MRNSFEETHGLRSLQRSLKYQAIKFSTSSTGELGAARAALCELVANLLDEHIRNHDEDMALIKRIAEALDSRKPKEKTLLREARMREAFARLGKP